MRLHEPLDVSLFQCGTGTRYNILGARNEQNICSANLSAWPALIHGAHSFALEAAVELLANTRYCASSYN